MAKESLQSRLVNDIEVRKIRRILKKVNAQKDKMAALDDQQLQAKTVEFRQRIKQGESLNRLLPEAFAAMREADKRILGMFPFDTQVMGGIVLHQGNVAELKTGEGKTLTATLPLYLNALAGKGAILVTTNEYLSQRDFEELRPVYEWMGLTVALGVHDNSEEKLTAKEKRAIYSADIVYTTNAVLGFDYLIENLASSQEEKYLRREFNYCIVDECDQVLLDVAQMPLVIAGAPRVQSNLYGICDTFVTLLEKDKHYELDEEERNVWLTPTGIEKAQKYFKVANIFAPENGELIRHVTLALRVHNLFELGKDYVVQDDEIVLLDAKNGRLMKGNKLQSGLHQAIEAREHIKITPDMRAMASITYQNFFRMFNKLAGMTGTAKSAEQEFIDIYYMKVVQVPTNRPIQRIDLPDQVYITLPEKLVASFQLVKKLHQKGQPVLLITASVEISEIYSEMLLQEGIAHSVLNANNAAREAEIIKEAGQLGAVTVATTMAGRGTDIKLPKEVKKLGGLAVIGTEKLQSQREDLQLRGRAGRQGDPGLSQFFVSLEDEVVIKYGSKWIHEYYEEHRAFDWDEPRQLTKRKILKAIQGAQEACDSEGVKSRKSSLEFDESSQIQRRLVYRQRDALIEQAENLDFDIMGLIRQDIQEFLKNKPDAYEIERYIFDNLSYDFDINRLDKITVKDRAQVEAFLLQIAQEQLELKSQQLEDEVEVKNFYRLAILKAIDTCWVEEVDNLQQLRTVVDSRQIAQRNPIYEYHKEAIISYNKMRIDIRHLIVQNLLLSRVVYNPKKGNSIYFA
ncbi:accessory Sec system translocase SecA2 [Ligilactobacillus equi]|uniref:Protein translocase subunit SecA n=1 Tax=Ligilactobacillus equi DPC 6820 TaxID=1392007 RepID=V7HU34_9LACO|nr:accessory Sec system translocase SecA2 [Ligilactobacillus equi]ETA73397.1 preprotein translocase subunit SecA [Ligilactobacillus equi DPC 6820]